MDNSDYYSEIEDEPVFQKKIYDGYDHPNLPEKEQIEVDKSFSYEHLDDVLDLYHAIQEIISCDSKLIYFLDKLTPGDFYHISLQTSLIPVDVETNQQDYNEVVDYSSESDSNE